MANRIPPLIAPERKICRRLLIDRGKSKSQRALGLMVLMGFELPAP